MKSALNLTPKIDLCWSNGSIVRGAHTISTLNASLHYSRCAWEGIRAYGGVPFKLREHLERLWRSAEFLGLKIPSEFRYSAEDGVHDLLAAIKTANLDGSQDNIYVRPIVYLENTEQNCDDFPIASVDIYAFPAKRMIHSKPGYRVAISSYQRSYPCFHMEAKVPANYVLNEMAKAQFPTFDDVLFQDRDGYITEGTVANLFVIKDDMIYTPPADGSILPGITRSEVIRLFSQKVKEQRITRHMLYGADAAFLTGTYLEIMPIDVVDNHVMFTPGKVNEIQEAYHELVSGKFATLKTPYGT